MDLLSLLKNNNILYVVDTLSKAPYWLNIKHDREQNLYIIKHCHKSDKTNMIVKECDGIILDSKCNIVCYSGKYGDVVSYYDIDAKINNINNLIDEYEFFEFLDGSCIRMYYFNNTWNVGTKGHTNAEKSKWSSEKNFLLLFQEALVNYPDFNTEVFDKNNTYVFLLQHTENKIVCPVDANKIYLLDVYNNQDMVKLNSKNLNLNVDTIMNLTIKNVNDIKIFLELQDISNKGIYINNKNNNDKLFVFNKLYDDRQKIKGNTLDINKRYLNLRCGNRSHKFLEQFPEYYETIKQLEKNIYDNVLHIHSLYIKKHVKKENITISQNEYKYLFPIHGYYLRTGNIITTKVVYNLMFCINIYFGTEQF